MFVFYISQDFFARLFSSINDYDALGRKSDVLETMALEYIKWGYNILNMTSTKQTWEKIKWFNLIAFFSKYCSHLRMLFPYMFFYSRIISLYDIISKISYSTIMPAYWYVIFGHKYWHYYLKSCWRGEELPTQWSRFSYITWIVNLQS